MARLSDCARCGFVHYILWSSRNATREVPLVLVFYKGEVSLERWKNSPRFWKLGSDFGLASCCTTPQSLSCVDKTSDFSALGRAWNPRIMHLPGQSKTVVLRRTFILHLGILAWKWWCLKLIHFEGTFLGMMWGWHTKLKTHNHVIRQSLYVWVVSSILCLPEGNFLGMKFPKAVTFVLMSVI